MITPLPHIQTLGIYKPGHSVEEIRSRYGLQQVLKLASNENPFGCSPHVVDAIQGAAKHVGVYNDGGMGLRRALAEYYNCDVGNITVNSGSDAIIHQIMRTYLSAEYTAVSSSGGFVSFGIAVAAAGARAIYTPLTPDYRFDVDAIIKAIQPNTKVVYIANPNNPTGTYITSAEFERIMNAVSNDVLVVMDEAYFEYIDPELLPEFPSTALCGYKNVITLRTFSKAYGLASLRVGYAIADESIVKHLLRTKLPFSPNGLGCAAGIAALQDQDFVRHSVTQNSECVEILQSTLTEAGYTHSLSVANFVMIDCGSEEVARELHMALLLEGFITRPLVGFGLPSCLRISTGTVEQTRGLANSLTRLQKEIFQD